jgi:hypothetical protein
MNIDPVFVAPLVPVKAITWSTAGSALIVAPICWIESFIAGNDESCGPCTAPEIAPVSSGGKKPFGIFMMSTTLSPIVSARTTSVNAGLSRTLRSVLP